MESFVKSHLDPLGPVDLLTLFEEYLESTPYDVKTKEKLRQLRERTFAGPPNEETRHAISAFIKTEFYDDFKFARWICPRPDHVKIWWGPWCKLIEKVVFHLPWFFKYIPKSERPAAINSLEHVAKYIGGTDFKSFESTITVDIYNTVELVLYDYMLSQWVELPLLHDMFVGKNHLRTRLGTKASFNGKRMSGDQNTSLGNGFVNLMILMFLCERRHIEFHGFVEGDDAIFAIDEKLTSEDYQQLGFDIKIGYYDSVRQVCFCGLLYSPAGEVVRDPIKFLACAGWTSSFIHAGQRIMWELQVAKALSVLSETPHAPVVAFWAHTVLKHAPANITPRFVNDYYHDVPNIDRRTLPDYKPTLEARLLVEDRFGLPVANQYAIEDCIQRLDADAILKHIPGPMSLDDHRLEVFTFMANRYIITL